MRVLIGGVGYQHMRDLSVGPDLIPALRALPWPIDVEAIHIYFGPVHMMQWLQERPGYYDRMVFLGSVEREREPGRVRAYRWNGALPSAEEIQQRVIEAVTGIIHLDNSLIIGQYFGVLAPDVVVVEIEPEDTSWGDGYSTVVGGVLGEVVDTVRRAVLHGCLCHG